MHITWNRTVPERKHLPRSILVGPMDARAVRPRALPRRRDAALPEVVTPPALPFFYGWKEAVNQAMIWIVVFLTTYLCLTGKQ